MGGPGEGGRHHPPTVGAPPPHLPSQTGLLCFSDDPSSPWLAAIRASLAEQGAPHTNFGGEQFAANFPYLEFPGEVEGCLDPGAGVVMADKALEAVRAMARKGGAVIRDGFNVVKVESWGAGAGGVRVEGEGGPEGMREAYTARSAVRPPAPGG